MVDQPHDRFPGAANATLSGRGERMPEARFQA
jgi:hypothetical protein